MSRTAPIARLALAYGLGVAAGLQGAPAGAALLLCVVATLPPIATSGGRILPPGTWLLVFAAGVFGGARAHAEASGGTLEACGAPSPVRGRLLAPPLGGSAPLVIDGGCGTVTVVLDRDRRVNDAVPARDRRAGGQTGGDVAGESGIETGRPVLVHGRWRSGRTRPWLLADSLVPDRPKTAPDTGPIEAIRWLAVRWRGRLVVRIHELFGRRGPLVSALTLARTEGMDRDLRERFAVAGIAHLLAISGFHVGVVAALASALLGVLPLPRRQRALASAGVTAAYVALIGFPVSACRAALILGLVGGARSLGRAPSRWGALGASALVLLALDPSSLAGAGFQLSFAGAAGLIAWSRELTRWLASATEGWRIRVPPGLLRAVAAGVAATVATAPIVAWHFGRISLVGVPATLVASPLVSVALPGALLSLVVSAVSVPAGHWFAGGTSLLLDALLAVARASASVPWASAWVTRTTVLVALLGVAGATWWARRPGVGRAARRRALVVVAGAGMLAWPVLLGLAGRGSLEVWMIDVGQGDALAVRTPRGRWFLVDAGPPSDLAAPAQPVVAALRSAGASALSFLLLTHADADHFGGASAVLESMPVGMVLDPALPVAKPGYADLLAVAVAHDVPWRAARAGQRLELDGVRIAVLAPADSVVARLDAGSIDRDANEASVVVRLTWRDFDLLLTGDAYTRVEERLAPSLEAVEALKVGHHGSRTSTGSVLLDASRPEIALLSVGARNRYGHPAPEVMRRLERRGVRVLRTDEHGTVRLRVDRGGRVTVRTAR